MSAFGDEKPKRLRTQIEREGGLTSLLGEPKIRTVEQIEVVGGKLDTDSAWAALDRVRDEHQSNDLLRGSEERSENTAEAIYP